MSFSPVAVSSRVHSESQRRSASSSIMVDGLPIFATSNPHRQVHLRASPIRVFPAGSSHRPLAASTCCRITSVSAVKCR